MASICLCMIARDEEKNIARCIRSVAGLAEEIVVVDTGSADDTINIAKDLGAKVYQYPWDDNFANARNFAIGKAESEWLLLLDADEALDQNSRRVIAEFVNTTDLDGAHFRIRNYTGRYSPEIYSLHSGLRLLRNSGRYHFHGEIHEQIVADNGENVSLRFTLLEAVVHHYGYLDEIVREKQKRRRNLPILAKQLEQNPHDPFTLFNMGNEYLSMQDYKTALQYYEQTLQYLHNWNMAFVPHLLLRIINCHESLGEYEKALQAVQTGLRQFPRCTDYEFRRGDIFYRLRRYTLAIESYETCLKMGTPPAALELLPGCGTYRPACQLGELYRELEDYRRAIHYYDLALSYRPTFYAVMYRLGNVLRRLYPDPDESAQKLLSYFSNPKYTPNALLGADILAGEGLYEQALKALENLTEEAGHEIELTYLNARVRFYQRQFQTAVPLLEQVCQTPEPAGRVLRGIRPASALMLFSAGLIQGDENRLALGLNYVQSFCTRNEYAAAALMRDIFMGVSPPDPHYPDEGKSELAAMLRILNMILQCHAFDLFEQMLHALNYVDSKNILLRLAQLYDDNGLLPLAADHVLRSIKELNALNAEGAGILLRYSLSC